MATNGWRQATIAISAGRGTRAPGDPMNVPIHLSSTYRAAEYGLDYGREKNAGWEAFEDAIGMLEGGKAVAFASGIAAIGSIFSGLRAGDAVVAPADAYSGTRRLLAMEAVRGVLDVRLVDFADRDAVSKACAGARLLWAESPSNPLLNVVDIADLAAIAHRAGADVAVDNTFATPLLQRPMELGADFVVHSATKLISGHSDILLGVAVGANPDRAESLRMQRTARGAIPGPLETYLALRGLRSLPARLDRAQATAKHLVSRLGRHPKVTRVRYPGLAGPDRAIARRQMAGLGTILSFEVSGGPAHADAICRNVQLIQHATSLGGPETLIERRARAAGEEMTPPALLRLSVGQEDVEDIWADLAEALDHDPDDRR